MKLNHLIPLAILALAPGITLAMNGNGAGASPQIQPQTPAVEPSLVQTSQNTAAQTALPPRDQFQSCSQLVSQARDKAHTLVDSATTNPFNSDLITRYHKELQESLGDVKQQHEKLYKGLTQEQQSAVQIRNANLMQGQDRLQNLVKEMERELTDSTLHSKDVADQARATQRELKSYQKEFRAMGKDLGFSAN